MPGPSVSASLCERLFPLWFLSWGRERNGALLGVHAIAEILRKSKTSTVDTTAARPGLPLEPGWVVRFSRPDLMDRINVLEIDHHVTQRKTLERIPRAGLTIPSRLHLVPTDLAKIFALDALVGSGFAMSRPTFLTLLSRLSHFRGPPPTPPHAEQDEVLRCKIWRAYGQRILACSHEML